VNDQSNRSARLRYAATGALAALAAAGAIAGTAALGAQPHANTHGHAAAVNSGATKTPTPPAPDKTDAPRPAVNHQPFLTAVQQLINDGTISAAEGQVLDREIQAGRVDTETLAASGFTATQLHAVQQALGNTKRALAPNVR
jgi:uncharacterized membrane protein YebE (DUF533 family)